MQGVADFKNKNQFPLCTLYNISYLMKPAVRLWLKWKTVLKQSTSNNDRWNKITTLYCKTWQYSINHYHFFLLSDSTQTDRQTDWTGKNRSFPSHKTVCYMFSSLIIGLKSAAVMVSTATCYHSSIGLVSVK